VVESKELRFRTNTLLKNLVGKDLINEDNIAIVELVKNSYDARSPTVKVVFDSDPSLKNQAPISRIVVADEGTGMSMADIEEKWLNIAYSDKKNSVPAAGAYFAGNKGVGRFSCDRLGGHMHLLTRIEGGPLLHLPINWVDFEVEGDKDRLIQDVVLTVKETTEKEAQDLSGIKFPKAGTILVITSLRSRWDREKLKDLKRSLERFFNPNQTFQRDALSLVLNVPSEKADDVGKGYHEQINGEVRNQIFEKLRFNSTFIESKITDGGKLIATELVHEGEPVFRLHETNTRYPDLEDVHIIIYYLNPYKKAYFTRQTGIRSLDFGSIFLFLNGFRVAPYGDRGNDWLGMDMRKTQGTTRYLSSRDVVGRIEVIGDEEHFAPISSREGLKNTDAFIALKHREDGYFIEVLRRLEKFVVDGLNWDSVPNALRDELRTSKGLDWNETTESYLETWDKKRQRIALSILGLIGASPKNIVRFWFNPALLEAVVEERATEVRNLLAEIEGIDPTKIDTHLSSGLKKVRDLVAEKEREAKAAKQEAVGLRIRVEKQSEALEKAKGERETYKAQTLFLKSVAPHEVKDLLTFHHQINHDSTVLGKYLSKAIREIRKVADSPLMSALEPLQKAFALNQRIGAVARFATKANFRAGIKKEPTDLAAFFDQYINNIAREFTASGIDLHVANSVRESFEVKASRVELSILVDNIISNSVKALAKRLDVEISLKSPNVLKVFFRDDGNGLSPELPDAESMFDLGVTTTTGSGLGLFHCRRIVTDLGGKITAVPLKPRGMEMIVEIGR
jgi:signal transduction histidine kinase